MFKLLKILKQLVNQLEKKCLKLELKNGYTRLFHRNGPEQAKVQSPKALYLLAVKQSLSHNPLVV